MIIILKIGLYGKNKRYLLKLAQYLEEDTRLQLFIFTKKEELIRFVNDKKLDYLIMDDEMNFKLENLITKIIYLSNQKSEEVSNAIYKYQSSRYIRAQLLKILEMESFDSMKETSSKIVGVYSPVSNSFKTSLAVLLGYQNLNEENTILLTLDKFSLLDYNKNHEDIYDFSDLLYCLEQGRYDDKLLDKAIGYLSELPYIYPLTSPEDLYKITSKQIGEFLERILNNYRRIVIDIGDDVINVVDFLDLCDVIYMPVIESSYAYEKIECFESYLKGRGKNELLNKIKKVNIPSEFLIREQWNVNYYNELKWCDFKV